MDLTELRENVYEIPREGEMRVPARVFASDPLLGKMREEGQTLQQIRNVATLPGIQKYSVVLPDGHLGYGFPIGGVAAVAMDGGVVSPGGIGFDINCLPGETRVLTKFGRSRRLDSLRDDVGPVDATVIADRPTDSSVRLFTERAPETVYEVTTRTGNRVEATADHPFSTPDGMVELGDLDVGDTVYSYPFDGVPAEQPPEFIVLDEGDFEGEDPQLLRVLRGRDLLPLRSTDDAFNHLLKLLGHFTGDGAFGPAGTTFYAPREDLESIRGDIEAVGFTPSRIYERDRNHEVRGNRFTTTETSVRATANGFKQLLVRLGAPTGRKVESGFTVPDYLDRLADWQRALYLSAFFGAEMSAPDAMSAKNLYCPSVSHNRVADREDAGREFVCGLMRHLNDLGIATNELETVERDTNSTHETVRLRFGIKNDSETLIRFFTTVGYRYSAEKQRKGLLAASYLRRKERHVDRRARVASEASALADGGVTPEEVKGRFDAVNDRFVERSIHDQRDGRPRPSASFPDYEEFVDETTQLDNGAIATVITGIAERGEKPVYDIGVEHDAHNFVANGFVVSNCGVRLLRTDLDYDDVRGDEQALVDRLYDLVPCGLGKGGYVRTDREDLEGILAAGMEWMHERGHARRDDLTHCEESGRLPGDPDAVPEDAKRRGVKQVGSLGSGNHFLEVQRVTDLYDDATAEAFGLREGQVVVMIHSGSRGLGHQVCQDYIRRFERTYPNLVDALPDRQLVYAPLGDEAAQDYLGAMYAAANFAWTNRQAMTQAVREAFVDLFDTDAVDLVYDVCHNVAKEETHTVDGEQVDCLVHRKGATRAFPAGHPAVPEAYRDVGQPVFLPGSMGTHSYVLAGGERSMDLTFGSTAHGAGRLKSRTQSKKEYTAEQLQQRLRSEGVYVKARSGGTVAEEAPGAYKDVDEVVRVSDALGIGTKVARMRPVCNIKG